MRWIPAKLEALATGLAAAAVALVTVPLGCSTVLPGPVPAAHPGDDIPRRGGTLHLASFTEMRNLDPAGPPDGLSSQASILLFDGLVDYDRQGHIVPNLAERWEIVDGGLTYRFFLRSHVLMHDGKELTADDVKRSVERSLHPSAPNGMASHLAGIVGFDAFTAGNADHIAGIAVEGRYVVAFHLATPDVAFLPLLGMPLLRPVCRSAGTRYTNGWLPCGTGPYRLEPGGWQRGTSLRLVRNPAYFRPELPYLDAIEWTFNTFLVPQLFRFEDGALDMILDPTQATVQRFQADPRWKGQSVVLPDSAMNGEAMNTRVPPFDNVEIRRAVAAAIDRDQYAMLRPANMTPLTQVLPPAIPGYDPSFVGQRYDVAAALEHMRKAGFPYDPATGRGGWPHPIPYALYDPGNATFTSQLLQQQLARIGLRIELRLMSYPAFVTVTHRDDAPPMSQQGNHADYLDPSAFFDVLFASSSINEDDSDNSAFYSNPTLDELLARGHRELDPTARSAIYHDANTIVCGDAPWAFTWAQHEYVLLQPYVRGFAPHPMWVLDLRSVWLDRDDGSVATSPARGLQ